MSEGGGVDEARPDGQEPVELAAPLPSVATPDAPAAPAELEAPAAPAELEAPAAPAELEAPAAPDAPGESALPEAAPLDAPLLPLGSLLRRPEEPIDAGPPPPLPASPLELRPAGAPLAPSRRAPRPPEPVWPWGVWLLLAALGFFYLQLLESGQGWEAGPTRLLREGGLIPGAQGSPRELWRLVDASFLHARPEPLFVSLFLLLVGGSALERAAGRGALLCLFVVGGAGLNALRCGLEASRSLLELAGAWPAGALLAGAAIGAGLRRGDRVTPLLAAVVFDLTLLVGIAVVGGHALPPLEVVLGVALVAGLVVGLLLEPRGEDPTPQGCLLGLVAVLALGSAQLARLAASPQGRPPAPWTRPTPPPELEEGLETRRLDELEVEVALPASWRPWEGTGGKRTECPECGASLGEGKGKRTCPECKKEVRPRASSHVLFVEPGAGYRRVQVWTRPKGAFDAPDTLAGNVLAGLERDNGPLRDPSVNEDRPFPGALGLGHLVWLETRMDWGGVEREMTYRMYLFVGARRTVRVDALAPRRSDPVQEAAEVELFDAIARSVKETAQ